MADFSIAGSGTIDLRSTNLNGFTGLKFATSGTATAQLNAAQFGGSGLPATSAITGSAFSDRIELFLASGATFNASAFSFSSWTPANDLLILRDSTGGESITGSSQRDEIHVSAGSDTVDGGAGDDLLVLDYGAATGNFQMNGASQFTNFGGTSVTFSNIERFNVTLGAGNDSITLGAGNDVVNAGGGDDSFDTKTGAAIVDGGAGNDTWSADFSGDSTAKTINLSLAGVQSAGNGTTYANIEALVVSTGSGNDTLISKTAVFNDTLNSGGGNDTLGVGGGIDVVGGGEGDDLLIVNYSAVAGNFQMNGASQFTNFGGTSVTFSNIERFNVSLGAGNDSITLGAGNDVVNAGGGDDSFDTKTGAAIVDGGAGNDTWSADFSGDSSAKTINLSLAGTHSAGNGTTYANIEALVVSTGSGNDTLISKTAVFNDTLNSGGGNDTLGVGGGNDVVDGGEGDDLLIVDYSAADGNFSMNGATQINNFSGTSVTFSNIERFNVSLGAGNDSITLGAGNDVVNAGEGNDSFDTKTGAAIVDGGAGDDTWSADFSGDSSAKTINLSLAGMHSAGNGTTYANIEALAVSTGSGNDTLISKTAVFNDTLNSGGGNDTLGVGGGNDVVDGGAGSDDLLIVDYSAATGNFSMNGATQINNFSGTSVTFSNIERFNVSLGAGNDSITLGAGDDVVAGGLGNDTLDGGAGTDTALYSDKAASVSVTLNGSSDATVSVGGVAEDTVRNIENITGGSAGDTLTGDGLDNVLRGLAGSDTLVGGFGNDTLDGGTQADAMTGGAGADIYYVDNAGDTVTELSNEGTDTVRTGLSYTLANNVEKLELLFAGNDFGFGNALANTINGNSGNNLLRGLAGKDTLDGGLGNDTIEGGADADTLIGGIGNDTLNGGTEADFLSGGLGDDTYVVENAGDVVTELLNEGTDTVRTVLSYSLGDNVENLTLDGTAAISGTGNALDNIFLGNGAANTLTGLGGNDTLNGGAGADTMVGGLGNDTYVVDDAGDIVTELFNQGIDKVRAAGSYTLGANLENLDLLYNGQSWGLGNALDNIITGNTGNNTLRGYGGNDTLNGGAGADSMTGGLGNDIYVVDNAGDTVTEVANEGTDTVQTGLSYTLGANVENLTLIYTGKSWGTGNELGNTIVGNTSDNVLRGMAGNDILTGGTGADAFVFNTPLNASTNVDTITDFTVSQGDVFWLDDAVFKALAPGALPAGDFVTGTAATNAAQNVVYDSATGSLFYDADGSGAGAQVKFASVGTNLSLAAANFQVI